MRRVEPANTATARSISPAPASPAPAGRDRPARRSRSRRSGASTSIALPRRDAAWPGPAPRLEGGPDRLERARNRARAARLSSGVRGAFRLDIARDRPPRAWSGSTRTSTSIIRSRTMRLDDQHLLGVLLPERGDVGTDDLEQLGHHGRDAAKVARPALPFELVRQALRPRRTSPRRAGRSRPARGRRGCRPPRARGRRRRARGRAG